MNPIGQFAVLLIALLAIGSIYKFRNSNVKSPTGQEVAHNDDIPVTDPGNYHHYDPKPIRDDSRSDVVRPPIKKEKNKSPTSSNGHGTNDRGKGNYRIDEVAPISPDNGDAVSPPIKKNRPKVSNGQNHQDGKLDNGKANDGVDETRDNGRDDDVTGEHANRPPINEEKEHPASSSTNHGRDDPNDDDGDNNNDDREADDKPQSEQEEPKKGEFCGVPAKQNNLFPKKRMVGGSFAEEHSWPWVVLLKRIHRPNNRVKDRSECIGSLIQVKGNTKKTDMLVTASHCIATWKFEKGHPLGGPTVEIDAEELQAIVGIHNANATSERIKVVGVRKHKNYTQRGYVDYHRYDVGLLKLETPIDFDDEKHPICFPKRTDPPPVGKKCAVVGFDEVVYTADIFPDRSRPLQQMAVAVQETKFCQAVRGKWNVKFDEKMTICAKLLVDTGLTKAAINLNDNGAPLHCFDEDTQKWRLYGTVTIAMVEDNKGPPFLFTHFSEFADWVRETADEMTSL